MIKRLYLANGQLVQPLDASSEDIAVDATLATMLAANLGIGDHCYLTLLSKDKLEVIRVTRDYAGYHVARGMDGTRKQGFPLGSKIVYRLTSAEVLDALTPTEYNIYADGAGYAYVEGGEGKWIIGAPEPYIETIGGILARVEDNHIEFFDNNGMFGCCDSDLTGATGIPGGIFYLTSMLYGYEGIDIMTPQPKDKNGNSIPPVNFDDLPPWYLLTQPFIYELYIGKNMGVLDWSAYGGQKSYTAPADKYISKDMGVLDWSRYGGQQSYTTKANEYIARDNYPLQMNLFGNAIVYDKYLDRYLLPTMAVLDWTLETP